jgi:hypothetical protein
MTTVELERSIKERLKSEDLLKYVNERQEQFLEFPDGFFVEIVLDDGSKLGEVERVVRATKEQLQKQGVQVDEIVRPLWRVANVERIGPAVSVSGGLKAALRFNATLESGDLKCGVAVDVTNAALDMIREELRHEKTAGAARKETADLAVIEVVREFLRLQLSLGGTSYWDPMRYPSQELNAAAFMYLMGRRDAFQRLKREIDVIFGAPKNTRLRRIRDFLNLAGTRSRDIEQILPDLPGPGGAFRRGQKLPTSNFELYSTLLESEKKNLKRYYSEQLDKAGKDFPELTKEHPKIFR